MLEGELKKYKEKVVNEIKKRNKLKAKAQMQSQVMGEQIKELEAEVQILKNTNPGDDFGELFEKAMELEDEQSQLHLELERNSEMIERVKEKNHALKEECQELQKEKSELQIENKMLKEGMEEMVETHQMQQASQAESYASREAELALRVDQGVRTLQTVYEELMDFARRQGFRGIGAFNNENLE